MKWEGGECHYCLSGCTVLSVGVLSVGVLLEGVLSEGVLSVGVLSEGVLSEGVAGFQEIPVGHQRASLFSDSNSNSSSRQVLPS